MDKGLYLHTRKSYFTSKLQILNGFRGGKYALSFVVGGQGMGRGWSNHRRWLDRCQWTSHENTNFFEKLDLDSLKSKKDNEHAKAAQTTAQQEEWESFIENLERKVGWWEKFDEHQKFDNWGLALFKKQSERRSEHTGARGAPTKKVVRNGGKIHNLLIVFFPTMNIV